MTANWTMRGCRATDAEWATILRLCLGLPTLSSVKDGTALCPEAGNQGP